MDLAGLSSGALEFGTSPATMSTPVEPTRILGLLLGAAVGDAVGLPREGLSPRRSVRLFGPAPLRHQLLPGRGLVSDDTEHACMTAEAFLEAPGDSTRFARRLAGRFRWWLAALPAGVGFATLRSGIKLWLGVSPERSGVRSAGNGPAMRSPILGACLSHDRERLRAYVRASTRLTHTDERAYEGAFAVAVAAGYAAVCAPGTLRASDVLAAIREECRGEELLRLLREVDRHLAAGTSPAAYAETIGAKGGVSGFIEQTVPAALFCWLRHPGDFRQAVESMILLGGDADTTAAIVGALAGATLGADAIPREWVDGLIGPPSPARLEHLAAGLAATMGDAPCAHRREAFAWPRQLLKNLLLLVLVLAHGFRRLLPPY
jgi:ADP-ribosyl-[dinitrogen reductase] hydrolase